MLTAQVEPYENCVLELKALYPAHWEELALDTEHEEAALAPLWKVYDERNAQGQLLLVTLRELGTMAGYFLGFIAPGLHYRNCLTYHGDIFRVLPEYRNRFGGLRMARCVIAECKRRGVKRMFVGEKLHMPSGRLFSALGFKPIEKTYSLWIE